MSPQEYWERPFGPHITIINSTRNNKDIGSSSAILNAKELTKRSEKYTRIESHGKSNVKVRFNSREQAIEFIRNTTLQNDRQSQAIIRKMLLQKSNVICGIPLDMNNDEIVGNNECQHPIVNVQTLKQRTKNVKVNFFSETQN